MCKEVKNMNENNEYREAFNVLTVSKQFNLEKEEIKVLSYVATRCMSIHSQRKIFGDVSRALQLGLHTLTHMIFSDDCIGLMGVVKKYGGDNLIKALTTMKDVKESEVMQDEIVQEFLQIIIDNIKILSIIADRLKEEN